MLSTPSPLKNKKRTSIASLSGDGTRAHTVPTHTSNGNKIIAKDLTMKQNIIIATNVQEKVPTIKLGGVFLEHAEKTAAAEAKSADFEMKVNMLEEERRNLKLEIETLKSQWKATANECMNQGSANTELSEVLQHLQVSKNTLENEVTELRHTICELEASNRVLEDYKTKAELRQKSNEMNRQQLEHVITVEKEENSTLTGVIYTKDEVIEALNARLSQRNIELDILKKSIGRILLG